MDVYCSSWLHDHEYGRNGFTQSADHNEVEGYDLFPCGICFGNDYYKSKQHMRTECSIHICNTQCSSAACSGNRPRKRVQESVECTIHMCCSSDCYILRMDRFRKCADHRRTGNEKCESTICEFNIFECYIKCTRSKRMRPVDGANTINFSEPELQNSGRRT